MGILWAVKEKQQDMSKKGVGKTKVTVAKK